MNFKEACKEMMEVTKGGYFTIGYEVRHWGGTIGRDTQSCRVYVPNIGVVEADTWKNALEKIAILMGKKESEPIDDIPEL